MATDIFQSDFAGVQSAPESAIGTQAAAGWRKDEPDDIGDFYAQMKRVARHPISPSMMPEKGAVVGLTSSPKLKMDLSRRVIEHYGTAWFRSVVKYPGGTGFGRFAAADATPTVTAVTSTGYTVPEGGALPDGVIIWAEGFSTAANNGLKVLAGTSTGTSIKTTGLTAEASPPTTAVVYVVGYQGAASDIAINASGNLTSVATVFTSLGLAAGMWIWLGGGTAAVPGLLGFTTAGNRGFARVKTVAAGTLTVDRRSQAWVAEVAGVLTIQIFFGAWWRNVAGTSSDYRELSHTLELAAPGVGAANATAYVYAKGACVTKMEIGAGSEDKVVVSMDFVATDMTAPSTTRATNASSPAPVIGSAAFTTADQVRRLRLYTLDEAGVSTDIFDWKFSVDNHVKPQVQQGTLGARRMTFGRFDAMFDLTGVCVDTAPWDAIRADTSCAFDVALRSADGTVLFDVPSCDPMGGAPQIKENEPVMLPIQGEAWRDATFNFAGGMSLFASVPLT